MKFDLLPFPMMIAGSAAMSACVRIGNSHDLLGLFECQWQMQGLGPRARELNLEWRKRN